VIEIVNAKLEKGSGIFIVSSFSAFINFPIAYAAKKVSNGSVNGIFVLRAGGLRDLVVLDCFMELASKAKVDVVLA